MRQAGLSLALILAVLAGGYFFVDTIRELLPRQAGTGGDAGGQSSGRAEGSLQAGDTEEVLAPERDTAPLERVRQVFMPGGVKKEITASWGTVRVSEIWGATNKERASAGLSPLALEERLSRGADIKVRDMFDKQYFEHVSPDGKDVSDLMGIVGYDYITVAENLAFGGYESSEAVVRAWMESPGHRANILNGRFTEIGIAVLRGEFNGETTWMAVQEFGLPRSACPYIDETLFRTFEANKAELAAFETELEERRYELETTFPRRGAAYERKVDEFNAFVAEYNALVAETKTIVEEYNGQVRAFNACAVE